MLDVKRMKVLREVAAERSFSAAAQKLGYIIAPFEAYPDPVRRTFFNSRGDEIDPIGNDNYAFNVSKTLGARVTCSLLRGAGEVFGKGSKYRDANPECVTFPNDTLFQHGADVELSTALSPP